MPEAAHPSGSVLLEVPAEAEYVAVLRAAAAVLATRLDFSLDEIDDLRILVDEVAGLLIVAGAHSPLRCEIDCADEALTVRLSGELPTGASPATDGFAWSIVRALAHDVDTRTAGAEHTIAVTRGRGPVLNPAG